jgi:hypothetical protein
MTSKMMNKAQAVAQIRKAGLDYIGPEEARAILNADAAPSGPGASPEPMPSQLVGSHHPDLLVDRYSLRPGVDFVRQLLPGAVFVGAEPRMFNSGSGDLPRITGCGESPDVLRFLPWQLRHAGFATASRAHLAALLEEGADGDPDNLQTKEGRQLLGSYFVRVRSWAIEPPESAPTDEEIDALFPSWSTVVHG